MFLPPSYHKLAWEFHLYHPVATPSSHVILQHTFRCFNTLLWDLIILARSWSPCQGTYHTACCITTSLTRNVWDSSYLRSGSIGVHRPRHGCYRRVTHNVRSGQRWSTTVHQSRKRHTNAKRSGSSLAAGIPAKGIHLKRRKKKRKKNKTTSF